MPVLEPPSHDCHLLWLRTRRLREEPNILNMSFRSRRWLGVPRPCDVLELDESESLPEELVSLLPERVVERDQFSDGSLVSSIWEPGKLPSSTAPLPLRLAPCW